MWNTYAFCECGFVEYAPGGSAFLSRHDACPECGTYYAYWEVYIARWVSDSVWYKPSTWGKGHWEKKKRLIRY